MAWRQGCMGSMNMQCELNLYSTFLKKVLFQQLPRDLHPLDNAHAERTIKQTGGNVDHFLLFSSFFTTR